MTALLRSVRLAPDAGRRRWLRRHIHWLQCWGSVRRCAAVRTHGDRNLTDLRTCLFFEQRRWKPSEGIRDVETLGNTSIARFGAMSSLTLPESLPLLPRIPPTLTAHFQRSSGLSPHRHRASRRGPYSRRRRSIWNACRDRRSSGARSVAHRGRRFCRQRSPGQAVACCSRSRPSYWWMICAPHCPLEAC